MSSDLYEIPTPRQHIYGPGESLGAGQSKAFAGCRLTEPPVRLVRNEFMFGLGLQQARSGLIPATRETDQRS